MSIKIGKLASGMYYHGSTHGNLRSLRPNSYGIIFLASTARDASHYAGRNGTVYEVALSESVLFDGRDPACLEAVGLDGRDVEALALWNSENVEDWFLQEDIKAAGFDGFLVSDCRGDEDGVNVGIYDPAKVSILRSVGRVREADGRSYEERAEAMLASFCRTLKVPEPVGDDRASTIDGLIRGLKDQDAEPPEAEEEDEGVEEDFPHYAISGSERKCLDKYRNFSYEGINSGLRNGTLDERLSGVVSAIDGAFRERTRSDGTVFRVVEDSGVFYESFREPAFLSTSTSRDYVSDQGKNFEDPLVLEISVPAGTRYLRPAADWDDDFEGEVLFPRGCFLRRTGRGKFEIIDAD